MTASPYRWVIAPEVQQLLDDDRRQRIDESGRQRRLPCQGCGGHMDPRVEDVAVSVLWAGDLSGGGDGNAPDPGTAHVVRKGVVMVVAFTHPGCAPSRAIHDPKVLRMADSTAPDMEAAAIFGSLNGYPLMMFDGRVTVHADFGGGLTDTASTTYLRMGFVLVATPLELLRPQEAPLVRDWVLEEAGDEFRLRRTDSPRVAYIQRLTPEVAHWVRVSQPGPALVLTGTGLSPADKNSDWTVSIEAARLAGRLVAARVPLRRVGVTPRPQLG